MKPLRIVAVDDEPLALRRLQLLTESLPAVTTIGAARSIDDGLRLIRDLKPDAILLDIELGARTGFDLLTELDGLSSPRVIFVSAFSHYAVAAFESAAIDYLLKPVDVGRLATALERVRASLAHVDAQDHIAELRSLVAKLHRESAPARPESHFETEFWIRHTGGDLVRVAIADVEIASAEDDYVRLLADGRSYLLRESLSGLERRLQPGTFLRVHRAHLVRRNAIRELRKGRDGGLEVTMASGIVVPAGRVHARSLRAALQEGRPSH